jgi:phosphatidylserine/phosphatidylglycerophosphate/cardiolipin synthase-like enzyme
MNRPLRTLFLAIFLLISPVSPMAQEIPTSWELYFSPNGGCTEAIIKELDKAKNTILAQAYSFTSAPIAKALLNGHKRGVKVAVILDKSQGKKQYSSADFMTNSGILTKIDSQHAIAHNKVIIIDRETVITGSFNFTKAAEESNAENLLIIHDRKLAERYVKNWQDHDRHSKVYTGRTIAAPKKPIKNIRFALILLSCRQDGLSIWRPRLNVKQNLRGEREVEKSHSV